jgi:hypothetical protein
MTVLVHAAWASSEVLVLRLPATAGPLVLATFSGAVALVVMLSGSVVYGRLAGAMAAATLASAAVAPAARGFSMARGAVTVVVPAAACVMLLGHHYVDPGVTPANMAFLLAALVLPWVATLRPLRRRHEAGQRLRRRLQPEEPAEGGVGDLHLAPRVLHHHRDGARLRDREEPRGGEVERPFDLALRRDVVEQGDHPPGMLLRVERGLQRHLHPPRLAAWNLEARVDHRGRGLSVGDAREGLRHPFLLGLREQRGEHDARKARGLAPADRGEGRVRVPERSFRIRDGDRAPQGLDDAPEVLGSRGER